MLTKGVAVLLVDMQTKLLKRHDRYAAQKMIDAQYRVLQYCIEHSLPVVSLELSTRRYGSTINLFGEFLSSYPRHRLFEKDIDNGFSNPGLETYLVSQDMEDVLVMGINASLCVRATAQGALNAGFSVFASQDLMRDSFDGWYDFTQDWYQRNTTLVEDHWAFLNN